MIQQVNLMLAEFKPKPSYCSLKFICIAVGVFSAYLVQDYIGTRIEVAALQLQAETLENKKVAKLAYVEKLKNIPPKLTAEQIQADLTALTAELELRKQLREVIEYQQLGNLVGFSQQLIAFAQLTPQSISLEKIELKNGGKRVDMKGASASMENLPEYLVSLKKHDAFEDASFGTLHGVRTAGRAMTFSFGRNQEMTGL